MKSIETGTIPDDWRQAKTKPIHKNGSRRLPSNYRPISLKFVGAQVGVVVSTVASHR